MFSLLLFFYSLIYLLKAFFSMIQELLVLSTEFWTIPNESTAQINEYCSVWAIDVNSHTFDNNRKGFPPVKYPSTPHVVQKLGDLKQPTKFSCTCSVIPSGKSVKIKILDVKPC